MANAILATPDDSITVTASSEATDAEVSNLISSPQPSEAWQSNSDTGESLVIDLGSAKATSLIFLARTNLTSSADYRVRGATSEANLTASPGHDSTVTNFDPKGYTNPHFFYWLSSAETFRWWRIDLNNSGAGSIKAGRIYVVDPWQFADNLSFGWGIGWQEETKKRRAIGGQLYATQRARYRHINFALEMQSQSELFDQAFPIDRDRGASRDVLVHIDPANADRQQDWLMYGLLSELQPISNPAFNQYEKRYALEELI